AATTAARGIIPSVSATAPAASTALKATLTATLPPAAAPAPASTLCGISWRIGSGFLSIRLSNRRSREWRKFLNHFCDLFRGKPWRVEPERGIRCKQDIIMLIHDHCEICGHARLQFELRVFDIDNDAISHDILNRRRLKPDFG